MQDPRFARIRSDPRFRQPKKHAAKVVVDQRFKQVFKKPKNSKGRVDKYGRPVSATQEHDNLQRFYRIENTDETAFPDYARGEALLESSDDDDDDGDDDSESSESGSQRTSPINLVRDLNAEVDLDEGSFADLDAQAAEYAQTHPDDGDADTAQSNRLAAVNLDWDHVRAVDIYKICASLVSASAAPLALKKKTESSSSKGSSRVVRGKVLSVRVYPSEFGRERMAREEKEGPPAHIFKKRATEDEEEINEKTIYNVGDENEYDEDALRKYQLERLRYFYAIITCDTVDAAAHIYAELEGTELERSANTFDLSFVPDRTTFEQQFRDEASDDSAEYRGMDFVTDALRHSKVKLTWDEDDSERNRITRRTLTRKEIEENDFNNLIASSDDESDAEPQLSRDKLRSLLLNAGDEELPEGWDRGDEGNGNDVDMEITFTPGLSDMKTGGDETTLEKYQRKMKEKRKKQKADTKVKVVEDGVQDEFFAVDDGKPARVASTTEELSLLVSGEAESNHFDMKAIIKAEKAAKRKGKKKRAAKEGDAKELQEDFAIDVNDARFAGLHDDHAFAIDPSNPRFKKTKGMAALLDERAKRQSDNRETKEKARSADVGSRSLESLVESVKRKSDSSSQSNGKRRKIQ